MGTYYGRYIRLHKIIKGASVRMHPLLYNNVIRELLVLAFNEVFGIACDDNLLVGRNNPYVNF